MKKAVVQVLQYVFEVEFVDSPTANAIYEQLPFSGIVNRWGQEIYFDVPFAGIEGDAERKEELNVGDVGFWANGSAITISFGSTPDSINGEPRSVEPITVIAKVTGDVQQLDNVKEGELIFFMPEGV